MADKRRINHLKRVLITGCRFDYSTATKLLEVCKTLKEQYGTLTRLLKQSQNMNDLSTRLQAMKGIGPKTTTIFLRDMQPIFRDIHS